MMGGGRMRSRAERTLAWPGDVIHTYSHFAATNGAKMVINLFLSVVMCIVCTVQHLKRNGYWGGRRPKNILALCELGKPILAVQRHRC